jgi:hypothetical protein
MYAVHGTARFSRCEKKKSSTKKKSVPCVVLHAFRDALGFRAVVDLYEDL